MPDFIGIGAARAGTSWLWVTLRKHPDIWTPRSKEVHFFDRRLESWYFPILPREIEAQLRYSVYFLKGKMLGKITGEITPAYALLSEEKIRLIYSLMPKVKILYIMRDPVQRAWSQAKKDFYRFNGKSLESATVNELISFFELPSVKRRGDYAGCIKRWLKFFNPRQFCFLFLEEVVMNPNAVLREVFKFLGVRSEVELKWDEARNPIHVSQKVEMPPYIKDYLTNLLYQQNDQLEALIKRKIPWKSP